MKRTKCLRCGYKWESKVPRPKECPRCKQRLDSEPLRVMGARPRAVRGEGDPLSRELHKRIHDTQRRIDRLTARIIKVEGRVGRIEKKLRKMGNLFG